MAEHIVAVFDTIAHADAAENALRDAGIPADLIERFASSAHEPAVIHETAQPTGSFWSRLFGTEDHEDRTYYEDHATSGRTVVSVRTIDNVQATEVMRLLESYHPENVQAEQVATGTVGAIPRTTDAELSPVRNTPVTAPEGIPGVSTGTPAQTGSAEEVIPLAQEQLNVGKRVVDSGTTRVRRYVVERPVEETIALRDETTTIERRAVTGGATTADATPFSDRTVEVRETREEPVVSKTANVAEEVVISKVATQRDEVIKDTVRKEEVEIEKPPHSAAG